MPLHFSLLAVLAATSLTSAGSDSHLAPSLEVACRNGFHIFNTIHSAMRQWGSSLNHNGMSVFRATIPKGTLFSHGGPLSEPPDTFEWLAFEMEHAENFAMSWRRRSRPRPPPKDPAKDQSVLDGGADFTERAVLANGERVLRGYLHTYQASRDLNVLYVDGTSAGKSIMGTMDMEDIVLLDGQGNRDPRAPMGGDMVRARGLCDLATEQGMDGIVRMEIGFELIYCNFSSGLNFLSALRQPFFDESQDRPSMNLFAWARAVSARYDGIGGHRVKLDFSSMVSAWFYPLNLTNPEPDRPDLPRLIGLAPEERDALRERVKEITGRPPVVTNIDWQASVVDMIVQRYSDILEALSQEVCGADEFASQVLIATNMFAKAPSTPDDVNFWRREETMQTGIERCSAHFLRPATIFRTQWTTEDELINEAVSTVISTICETLFHARKLVLDASPELAVDPRVTPITNGLEEAVEEGKVLLKELMGKLKWTTWKKCRGCAANEVCFVAMWPYGTKEDHYFPRCLNWTELNEGDHSGWTPGGYWKM